MKTSYIASKTSILQPLIVAVIFILLTLGCEEPDYIMKSRLLHFDTQESNIESPWYDTTFVVDPSGTHIIALDGKVELRFVEGAVLLPTEFYIMPDNSVWPESKVPNFQIWGIGLYGMSEDSTFHNKVRIWMTYDQFPIGTEVMLKEDNLTIYTFCPNIKTDTGVVYRGFCSIDNCSMSFSNKRISGYISGCGYYRVGEK